MIVAEGDDAGGAKEIYDKLKPLMPDFTLRYTILGHLQRGGSPSAFDRILATRMGNRAVHELLAGHSDIMIGSKGDELITLPLLEAGKKIASPNMKNLELIKDLKTIK